jgi:hypothetical protein
LVNGKNYDWEDFDVHINGILSAHVTELNYTDEKEKELLYGAGSDPVGMGYGNYKASGDITLKREGFDILNNVAKSAGKTIYDFKPFLIVASYGSKSISEDTDFVESSHSPLHTDSLINVSFTKRDFGIKQNDKENTVKIEFICEKVA